MANEKTFYFLVPYTESGQAKILVTAESEEEAREMISAGDIDDCFDTDAWETEYDGESAELVNEDAADV